MTTQEEILEASPRARWGRYRGGYWANVMMLWVGRHCLWLGYFFGWFGAAYFFLVAGKARRASMEYLDRIWPGRSALRRPWDTYRHMEMFSRLLLDRAIALASPGIEGGGIRVRPVGEENLTLLADGGLFITAHFGNAEIVVPYVRDFGPKRPLHMVMHMDTSEGTEQFHQRYREALKGIEIINTADPLSAGLKIIQTLGSRDLVGMRADRVLAGRTVEVRFLGAAARMSAGPFVAAVLSGKPVVQIYIVRLRSRQYDCLIGEARRYSDEYCPGSRDERIQHAADDFARDLETIVRKYPLQWGNFFPYWADTPDGNP